MFRDSYSVCVISLSELHREDYRFTCPACLGDMFLNIRYRTGRLSDEVCCTSCLRAWPVSATAFPLAGKGTIWFSAIIVSKEELNPDVEAMLSLSALAG